MKNITIKTVLLFLFLPTFFYCGHKSGPYSRNPFHPSNAYGMSLYDPDSTIRSGKESESLDLQNRSFPLMFPTTIPAASTVDIVSFRLYSTTVLPVVFGNSFHSEHLRNLQTALDEHIKNAKGKIRNGNVLVVNNIQFSQKTSPLHEFNRHYIAGLVLRTEIFNVVVEIAEISPAALTQYLNGGRAVPAAPEEQQANVANFKGVVFNVTGKNAVVVSPEITKLRIGNKITFLNRSGQPAGTGVVKTTFHTKVDVTITSGTAEKGFNAVRYR